MGIYSGQVEAGEVTIDHRGLGDTILSPFNPLYIDWVANTNSGLLTPFVRQEHLERFHYGPHTNPPPELPYRVAVPRPLGKLFSGGHTLSNILGNMYESKLPRHDLEDFFAMTVTLVPYPKADKLDELTTRLDDGSINYRGIGARSIDFLIDFVGNGLYSEPS
jgi:hypothetical protein